MIVGFTGRKGSGKDAAGAVLASHGAKSLKFAQPLKNMLVQLLAYQGLETAIIYEMIEGNLKEKPTRYLGGRSPRYAMQTLGTEWGRMMMAEDLWVNAFANAAEGVPVVVCTDVRFPNEVAKIKELDGSVYRIDRPGIDRTDEHPSEALIDTLEVTGSFDNSAPTVGEFQDQIFQMFRHLEGSTH
jgi:hypothetical protein